MLTERQIRQIRGYCCENIKTIQNYEEAISDEHRWECHHLLEIQEDGPHTKTDLISKGLYYHRPVSELILLPRKEHRLLHSKYGSYNRSEETKQKMSDSRKGEKNPMYKKRFSEEHKQKLSEARKAYLKKKIDELLQ